MKFASPFHEMDNFTSGSYHMHIIVMSAALLKPVHTVGQSCVLLTANQ